MKRCSKCVLPETYPAIKFNEGGVCNFCSEKREKKDYARSDKLLRRIFRHYKKRGGKYDCLVPLSGGKDSTYVLYICREIYKLNVLSVNFNNGFRSPTAVENIDTAVKRLNVDYFSFKHDWNLMKKLYYIFLLKTGDFCSPCNAALTASIPRIAITKDIPLVIVGNSYLEDFPEELAYFDQTYFQDVLRNEIPLTDTSHFILPWFLRRKVQRLAISDYVEWNEERITDTLRNELGWKELPDHGDCVVAPVKNYLWQKKWGFGKPTVKYSAMIRYGQIGREEALQRISLEDNDSEPKVMSYFLEVLGLTKEDIKQAINRSHQGFKKDHTRARAVLLRRMKKMLPSRLYRILNSLP